MCFDWIIYKIYFLCFLLLEQSYIKIVHIACVDYKQGSLLFCNNLIIHHTHTYIFL